jgi:exopolysaccharide biosynthesis polyprenyl glycosylphosphotransferase
MNKHIHTFKYIVLDFISASIAWIIFNLFRKRVIESVVFGSEVDLKLTNSLIISTITIAFFWLIIYYFSGYYYNIYRKSRLQELIQTFVFSLLGNIFLFFTLILDDIISSYHDYYYLFLVLFGVHFILTYIPRNIFTSLTIIKIRKGLIGFNTLIIGSSNKALEVIKSFSSKNLLAGYRFIGFIDVNNGIIEDLKLACRYLGNIEQVEQIVAQEMVEEVIVAIESHEHKEIEKILSKLQLCNVSIKIIPDIYEILIGKTELALIEATPLLLVSNYLMPIWERNIKYLIDKIFAFVFLIVFSPLYFVIAIAVKFSSNGPVIYKQKRVGLNGKEFTIFKFRSMFVDSEKSGPELSTSNDKRVTKLGQFLRSTRLDEIPQFFNVLIGDMSLVGPRPERRFYIDQIIKKAPEYMMLLRTRPGITSLGQVKYGYAENIDQMLNRLKYDIIYIKNMSLYFDFKILIYTVLTLMKQNGK